MLRELLGAYIKEKGFVRYQIDSYNEFVKKRFSKIVKNIGSIKPEIPNVGKVKIKFLGVELGKYPRIVEKDGTERKVYPYEARIRNLTYSVPMYLKVITEIDGTESEPKNVYFGEFPVMVKSVLCPLSKMSEEELIKIKEDPDDPGGYFIINGTERILILFEELAPNRIIIRKTNSNNVVVNCRINSEKDGYVLKQLFELKRDGIITTTFTALKNFPVVILFKALGIENDELLLKMISKDKEIQNEFLVNLYEYPIATQEEALDEIGKYLKLPQKRLRIQRAQLIIDKYFLLHLGQTKDARLSKALFLAKIVERMIATAIGKEKEDDIDHYMNKRVRLAGELFEILMRTILLRRQGVIARMIANFQKFARKGKLPPIEATIESNYVTNLIQSAMAVGTWIGNRTGTSQRLERINLNKSITHMRLVSSPLKTTQEHFEARELHPTHFGKLCIAETPEGPTIGLRKYLAIFSEVTYGISDEEKEEIKNQIKDLIVKHD